MYPGACKALSIGKQYTANVKVVLLWRALQYEARRAISKLPPRHGERLDDRRKAQSRETPSVLPPNREKREIAYMS